MGDAKDIATVDDDDDEFDDEDEDYDDDFDEEDIDDLEQDNSSYRPQALCRARFLKGAHLKYKRVLYQIRGRSYREALMLLEFMPWRHCKPVLKAVQSAAANGQNF